MSVQGAPMTTLTKDQIVGATDGDVVWVTQEMGRHSDVVDESGKSVCPVGLVTNETRTFLDVAVEAERYGPEHRGVALMKILTIYRAELERRRTEWASLTERARSSK